MIKMIVGSILGVGLYMFLSYYQPVVESSHATTQAEASEVNTQLMFESPIPYDLIVLQK